MKKPSIILALVFALILASQQPAQTYGTYYLQSFPAAPYPFDPYFGLEPITVLDASNHIYLVQDSAENFTAMQEFDSMNSMSLMDVPYPGEGGGGTNELNFNLVSPDYGTNLWLEITGVSGSTANLLLSNTVADVQYEILGISDLANTNWITHGFVLGSELTNWTTTIADAGDFPNHFYKALSWQDTDGNGLPDWWQLQYFGHLGVDPYADPDGDGWNNLQEFQNRTEPNSFDSPLAPQVSVSLNAGGIATLNWQTLPGPVINYTIIIHDYQTGQTTTNVVFAGVASMTYDMSGETPVHLSDSDPEFYADFSVQGNYSGGDSDWGLASLQGGGSGDKIILGEGGYCYLVLSQVPSDLSKIRFYRESDQNAYYFYSGFWYWPIGNGELWLGPVDLPDDYFDIPASSITNGIAQIPSSQIFSYGYYTLWFQTESTNGIRSAWSSAFAYEELFLDGRQQMKDNLRFLLRASTRGVPFEFNGVLQPTNFVYSGFYQPSTAPWNSIYDSTKPFKDNALYKNFIFDQNNLRPITTSTNGDDFVRFMPQTGGYYHAFPLFDPLGDGANLYIDPPAYIFDIPSVVITNSITLPSSYLDSTNSRWILPGSENNFRTFGPLPNQTNFYGLKCLSVLGVTSTTTWTVYTSGTSISGNRYYEEAQPSFQTLGYYFANPQTSDPIPEDGTYFAGSPTTKFAATNNSKLILTSPGRSIIVAGYAKLGLQNGVTNKFAYLGQYFDKAYETDTSGNATTNLAGVVSPYGDFYCTSAGKVALVTMPDIDTGERGTCAVYSVSLNLDANHDGNMDLSWHGTDSQPLVFWVNNDYDRQHTVDFNDLEQDDVLQGTQDAYNLDPNHADSDYTDNGIRVIPCTRDLEDFARLWISGIDSDLVSGLPLGSTITLSWGDTDWPNPSNPTIDIFHAYELDGGIAYLTNSTTAAGQINPSSSPYLGRLGPGQSIQFDPSALTNWGGNHFIWCGVSRGSGQLFLKISDSNGSILAQTSVLIQLKDIKEMYERWTVGDNPSTTPTNTAHLASEDLPADALTFQYTQPQDTNTAYILFVHGWNEPRWEKDRFAETSFKRLYWQGYQGRFGEFRWPTYYAFLLGEVSYQAVDLRNFDNSEFIAWKSGAGLKNLLASLNVTYPNHVYLFAHSQGNIVAGEALRLAGTNRIANTYVAMQAAVPSHAYDATTPTRPLVTFGANLDSGTPDRYASYPASNSSCYFNGSSGAGTYVNFFNTNDWALTKLWQPDENIKPDTGYGYDPDGDQFYKDFYATPLYFTNDTYEIFSFADEARSYALGAQPNVGGVFKTLIFNQVELNNSPFNFSTQHKYHSGEFRADYAQRWQFWDEVLFQMGLKTTL